MISYSVGNGATGCCQICSPSQACPQGAIANALTFNIDNVCPPGHYCNPEPILVSMVVLQVFVFSKWAVILYTIWNLVSHTDKNQSSCQLKCPTGKICHLNEILDCVELQEQTENIGLGDLHAGSFCPGGSHSMGSCPSGFYCPDASTKIICPKGFFCPFKVTQKLNADLWFDNCLADKTWVSLPCS